MYVIENPMKILCFYFSDTQTILTIQNHVITKNHRISILHSEHKTWQLKIKDIRESDRGFYMVSETNGFSVNVTSNASNNKEQTTRIDSKWENIWDFIPFSFCFSFDV